MRSYQTLTLALDNTYKSSLLIAKDPKVASFGNELTDWLFNCRDFIKCQVH